MDQKQNTDGGLIVGIDITQYYVQVSCLPFQGEKAETISTQMGVDNYEIPLCLFKKSDSAGWYYGHKAKQYMYSKEGIYVEDLWKGMLKNREMILEDETYSYEQLLTIFFEKILVLISQNGYTHEPRTLVFTTEHMDNTKINALRRITGNLPVNREQTFYIDYRESFGAYATNAQKDLWNHDVFLFHYEGRNLKAYQLRVNQKTLPFQMRIGEMDFGEMEYSRDELEASEEAGNEMDLRFDATIAEVFERKIVSAVYLIGDGFLPGWMKLSLRTLCRGRRVFQGNNLFTKGACYAGRWYLKLQKPVGVYTSSQMLQSDVRIPAVKNGDTNGYLCVAKKGDLWYCAGTKVECIADTADGDESGREPYQIELEITGTLPGGEACTRIERLELEEFPKRPKKASKLLVTIVFLDEATGDIIVEDLGLGEFYPPSGLKWEKQFSLKVEMDNQKEGAGL